MWGYDALFRRQKEADPGPGRSPQPLLICEPSHSGLKLLRMSVTIRTAVLAAFGTVACLGADWPMFRGGPALLGVAEGSLPAKPALLWSFKTGGPVKSSAAIVGDRVFIGSGDGNLYALDLARGKKLWSFKTGDEVESSPLVLDGKVRRFERRFFVCA
jgi:outer membrane protein assembly factor BamB